MKFILGVLLVIFGLSVASMFFPALIGILIGLVEFDSGNTFGGIVAITIGLVIQGLMLLYFFSGAGGGSGHGYSEEDKECLFCGSGDTDGNHCYTCDEDF